MRACARFVSSQNERKHNARGEHVKKDGIDDLPTGLPVRWMAVVPAVAVAVSLSPRVAVAPDETSTLVRSSVVVPLSLCLLRFAFDAVDPGLVVL